MGIIMVAALAWGQTPPEPEPAEPVPKVEPPEPESGSEAEREAALFGPAPTSEPLPSEPPSETQAPPPTSRDDAMLGGEVVSVEGGLAKRLAAMDDRLVFGGRLWSQAIARIPEGVNGLAGVTLDGPSLFDLYADARPNDQVRAYARARLQHDWSVRQGDLDPLTGNELQSDAVFLDQLWTKFDVAKQVYVTVGRQRIRWGTGRFWNPTDFMNQQRLDPLAALDLRFGVDMVKVHVPIERADANLYALVNVADARSMDEIGGALRGEWSVGQTEVSGSVAARKDQPLRLGTDLSSGIGLFDIRAELAAQRGANGPFYEGAFRPRAFVFPTEVDRSDEWLVQTVLSAEVAVAISAEDALSVGVEWFHNALGYPDARLYPWLFANGAYVPLYTGRDYGAIYLFLPSLGPRDDQTFIISALSNLSDRSVILRGDWRTVVNTWLEPQLYVQWHTGANGEFHYAVDIKANPALGLDAIKVPAPAVDVGLSAIVRF